MSSVLESSSHESSRRRVPQKQRDRAEEFDLLENDKVPKNWFTFMLSYPLQKHMSLAEVFTQWSAILLYFPIGVLSICDPKTSGTILGIESGKHGNGIARISGMQITELAFLYVIFSRASPSISSNCIILATTFERIVVVNIYFLLAFWQQLLPAQFLLSVILMDTGLSVITIVLWFHESGSASVGKFFGKIFQAMSLNKPSSHYSSRAVQILGLVQMFVGCAMVAFPNLNDQILFLSANDLDGHSKGLLSLCHFSIAVIGFIHFLSGGADSKAYNMASVFYRLVFSIPAVVALGISNQTPFGLMGYVVCLDAVSLSVISLTLCIDKY